MSSILVNTITNAAGGNTAQINGMTPTADSLQGFRNRIINGNMVIAQRGTAAVTSDNSFPVDRINIAFATDGGFSAQQSTTAPTGFTNSVQWTTTTADADLGTTQRALVMHNIEGTNVADLGWGTANASAVTLSFWVRSSLTGTFGGSLANSNQNRSYPFTYTISAANTWEQKTITIPGDTTGTWVTGTGLGLRIRFSMGVGSSFRGAAGAWAGSDFRGATGETNVMATLSATWFITGVQLEAGSVATPFERRPYGTELALCQRYCEIISTAGGFQTLFLGQAAGATLFNGVHKYVVEKRASPTLTINNLANTVVINATGVGTTAPTGASISPGTQVGRINFTGTSGLVAGNAAQLLDNGSSAPLFIFSAEL
jgi:hypothetical protein